VTLDKVAQYYVQSPDYGVLYKYKQIKPTMKKRHKETLADTMVYTVGVIAIILILL